MIRILILLLVVGLVLSISYFGANVLVNQTGKILTKSNILKLNYYISAFTVKNYTKVVITFTQPLNLSCVNYVKIDNRSVKYNIEKLRDDTVEVNIYKVLKGVHNLEIDFCEGRIKDVVWVQ